MARGQVSLRQLAQFEHRRSVWLKVPRSTQLAFAFHFLESSVLCLQQILGCLLRVVLGPRLDAV